MIFYTPTIFIIRVLFKKVKIKDGMKLKRLRRDTVGYYTGCECMEISASILKFILPTILCSDFVQELRNILKYIISLRFVIINAPKTFLDITGKQQEDKINSTEYI